MSDPYRDNWPKTFEAEMLAAFLGAGFEGPNVNGKNMREAMLYALGLPMDARAEIDRLRAQVAEMREDAERYRWLAAHCRSTSEHWGGRWSIVVDGPAPVRNDCEDAFHAAIDRARKSGDGGQG